MPETKRENNPLKIEKGRYYYEGLSSKRLCDSGWWIVRKQLKQLNLEVNENNLLLYFNVYKLFNGRISALVEHHALIGQYAAPIKNSKRLWAGREFKKYLKALQLLPQHLSTFTRWFDDLGGYASEQQYDYRQLFLVLGKAVIYKSKKRG